MTRPEDSVNIKRFMATSDNRKHFLKTCDSAKKFKQQQSKVKFLKDCLLFKVIPVTIRVRHSPIQEHDSDVRIQCEKVRDRASLEMLKISIKREEVELTKRKQGFRSRLDSLASLCEQVWPEVQLLISKALERYWRACANTHRLKLKALLVKQGREVPSCLHGTPTLPTEDNFETSDNRSPFATPPSSPQRGSSCLPQSGTPSRNRPRQSPVTSTPAVGVNRDSLPMSPVGVGSPVLTPFQGFSSHTKMANPNKRLTSFIRHLEDTELGGEQISPGSPTSQVTFASPTSPPTPLVPKVPQPRGRLGGGGESPPCYGFPTHSEGAASTAKNNLQILIDNLEQTQEEELNTTGNLNPISQESDSTPQSPVVPQPRGRRRFIPRNRFRRAQAARNRLMVHQSLVTNCSSFPLSDDQDKLLSRGLNFVPTPSAVNKSLMLARWQKFVRAVRWQEFWHGKVKGETDPNGPDRIFKKEKTNLPPYQPPKHLRTFIQAAKDDVFLAPLNQIHPNLPQPEQEAVNQLIEAQRRGDYKILPNDKSGGVTVVDLHDYKMVVKDQLEATYVGEDGVPKPYYRPTCAEHLHNLRGKAQALVEEGVREGFIHPGDASFMIPDEAKPGRYYGLAKVHKPRQTWPQVTQGRCPPLRPVVSGSGTVSEGISHWVDEKAKSEVKKLPTFLEDTRHLLQMIQQENQRGPQPPGTVPVTLDIIGMYTNVPYEEGLQAFAKLMEQRDNKEVPTWFLVKLMRFVAESSIFVFDTELFLQLLGVAMGSKSSPTFACLFVGILEGVMLRAWQIRGGSMPHMLRRFIDDIFFLWRDGEEHLKQFIAHLNGFHRTIKFEVTPGESYNFQTRAINFLDLKIWIDEKGFIQTTLFQKPCRVVSYLLPSSSHPGFITRNIPYSLAYRLVRIESTQEGLEQNLNKLQEELVGRGYRQAVVQSAMARARQLSRATALVKVQKPANKRPVFCMPYDPRLPPVTGILKKRHTALLARDVDAREYFPQPPLVTFTRSKNLRDIIFRAQVPRISRRGGLRPSRPPGFFKCRRRTNCTLCLHSEEATSYTCPITGAVAQITQHITCQSSGVYLLLCRKTNGACARVKPLYVGICATESESSFTHRMAGHVGTAVQPCQEDTNKSVGAHFRLPGHVPHRDMQMLPIEVISGKQPFLLQVREAYNIEKFGTEKRLGVREIEHGMNLSPGML